MENNKATERLEKIENFLKSDFCLECSQTMEKSEHYCEYCNNTVAIPFTFSDIAINKVLSNIDIIIEETKKEYEEKIQQLLQQKGEATKEQIKAIIKKHNKELLEKIKPKKLKVAVNTPMLMLKAGEYYKAEDIKKVLR